MHTHLSPRKCHLDRKRRGSSSFGECAAQPPLRHSGKPALGGSISCSPHIVLSSIYVLYSSTLITLSSLSLASGTLCILM